MSATASCFFLVALANPVSAHFRLNVPLSRNGLSCNALPCNRPPVNPGIADGGSGVRNAQSWFTNNVVIETPTLTPAKEYHEYLTMCTDGGVAPDYKDCEQGWGQTPWRAPGTGRVDSACGLHQGNPGELDGADLIPVPAELRAKWVPGQTAEVAWGVTINHAGGYSYRLCPASEPLTEECFQRMPLRFAGNTSDIVDTDGKLVGTIQAKTLSRGTFPEGSEWKKNPIPWNVHNFPAPFGLSGSPRNINVVDRVQVPADLAPGDYVLSYRQDCEETPEIWTNCADITVVSSATLV